MAESVGAATFYPWDIKGVHILELLKISKDSDTKGMIEIFGYFSPDKIPFRPVNI